MIDLFLVLITLIASFVYIYVKIYQIVHLKNMLVYLCQLKPSKAIKF